MAAWCPKLRANAMTETRASLWANRSNIPRLPSRLPSSTNTISKSDLQNWIVEGIIDYEGEKKDIRKFIARADCIVLPSYREGTSNILLEAASMEKPIITTNTTGCKETVEDGVTGFLCNVKDSRNLAEKMEQMFLLSCQERKEMGKKARQKIIKEFDKEIVLTAYLKAIKEVFS